RVPPSKARSKNNKNTLLGVICKGAGGTAAGVKGLVLRIGIALLVLRTACGGLCRKTRGGKKQHCCFF
ncbi:MAG: hypothetical protein IJO10_02205, partial [Clostridia bacterium]|nr:hypothetical protein [Clostridia bacterium]